MHVCMLTYYYWPHQAGGTENQCRRLAAQLVRDGISCEVLTSRYDIAVSSKDTDNGVPIRRVPTFETVLQFFHLKSRNADVFRSEIESITCTDTTNATSLERGFWQKSLSSFLSLVVNYGNIVCFSIATLFSLYRHRHTIDILHVHTADWIAGLAAFAGKMIKVPVVCKGADTPVFPELSQVPLPSVFNRWRKRPYFIALTEAMRDDLVSNDVIAKHISVIPNGVVVPDQCADPGTSSTFLYVGNFSQTADHKGFDVLIEAWAQVAQERADAKLVMVGRGDAGPWKRMADDLGCSRNIVFEGYKDTLAPYYKNSCCLLLPSRKEGMSNAVLEAHSYGLPVIASDLPGSRAVVVHGETGLIVEIGNVEQLSGAIIQLIDNADERKRFGAAARQRAKERFSMEAITALTIDLYQRIVENRILFKMQL